MTLSLCHDLDPTSLFQKLLNPVCVCLVLIEGKISTQSLLLSGNIKLIVILSLPHALWQWPAPMCVKKGFWGNNRAWYAKNSNYQMTA